MPLPRPASPRALWADIRAFLGERTGVQWGAALFAIAMPVTIITIFYFDSQTNIMPGEQLIYAESWSADRSDEEIKADQAVREERRQAIAAERQRQFKEVERRFGL